MSEIKSKLWNGRKVKEGKVFKVEGTFQSYYAAEAWIRLEGYSSGSPSMNRGSGRGEPIALIKGQYNIPQKWHNLSKVHKSMIDGVMLSDDLREGEVKVILFEDKTNL